MPAPGIAKIAVGGAADIEYERDMVDKFMQRFDVRDSLKKKD
jgi:hypothetical protein